MRILVVNNLANYHSSKILSSYRKRKLLEKINHEKKLFENYNKIIKTCNPRKNHVMTQDCVVTWKEIENLHLILERLNSTLDQEEDEYS